jgi:CheY-like chemotaxis protein
MHETGGVLTVDLRDVEVAPGDAEPDLPPGPYVRLAVADTGPGIPPELRDRLFEPYFTTKDKGVGTGLGLSVAHGIVKRHGGEITVTPGSGRGATFAVYLPRLAEAAPADFVSPQETPRGTERVLLVDDEPALVALGERMLQRLGYTVTVRSSAAEALATIRARPDDFDLLITDQTMPGMAGDALAQAVLEERAGFPIILCSGFSETVTEASVRAAGIRAYLMKPFTISALATTVRTALSADE